MFKCSMPKSRVGPGLTGTEQDPPGPEASRELGYFLKNTTEVKFQEKLPRRIWHCVCLWNVLNEVDL